MIIKNKYRILLTVFTLLFYVNSFSIVVDSLENNYNFPLRFRFKPKKSKPILPSISNNLNLFELFSDKVIW